MVYNLIYIDSTMDIEEKLKEFKALDANAKKEKLIAIFEYAKDRIDFSETAISYLSSDSSPEDLVMDELYEFIVEAVITAQKRIEEQDEHQVNIMKKLSKEAELSAQKDSEDAENLLGLINLL